VSDVLWQRLDQVARHVSPFAITVLLLIVGLVPLRLPYLPPLSVSLVLVSVYYWAVHRPGALPAPAVFFLGLMADLLGGGFLGVNALVLLVAYASTLSLRPWLVGASFAIVWWGFAILSVAALVLTWIITWFLAGAAADFSPGVSGTVFAVGAYPLLATLFARTQRALLR
jgi:rod shape-determining protein MreD